MATVRASVERAGERQYRVLPSKRKLAGGLQGDVIGHSLGTSGSIAKNEIAISRVQIDSLRTLYTSQPAIQACRSVLLGELLCNGFELVRDGDVVATTAEFTAHLRDHWTSFARDMIDSFLVAGFATASSMEITQSVPGQSRRNRQTIPIIAPLETYQLSFVYEKSPYFRDYKVYPSFNVTDIGDEDPNALVFIRQAPDAHGNVVSPTASCFEIGNSSLAFMELAVRAETVRAKQMLVTQPADKGPEKDPLGSASMFFDAESREIQTGLDKSTNEEAAESLSAQVRLCNIINRLQNKGDSTQTWMHYMAHHGRSHQSFVPPSSKPEMLSLPKELAPAAGTLVQAEARGDLVAINTHAVQQFAAAFGVPSTLIHEGKFVGNSGHSLRLLNTTVAQIASTVEDSLSQMYRSIYGGTTERLRLRVSPLAAVQDVVLLTTSGIADAQSVQSMALRSVGLPPDEVQRAAERLEERQEQTNRLALQAAETAAAQVAAKAAEDEQRLKQRAAGGTGVGGAAAGAAGP